MNSVAELNEEILILDVEEGKYVGKGKIVPCVLSVVNPAPTASARPGPAADAAIYSRE